MGRIEGHAVDLSPANRLHQLDLLGRAIRGHLEWPGTRYLDYAAWRRDRDIAETGNDARFTAWHPALSRELHAWDMEHLTSPVVVEPGPIASSSNPVVVPVVVPTATTSHVPSGTPSLHAVPEPSPLLLLGVGFALLLAAVWRKSRREAVPTRY